MVPGGICDHHAGMPTTRTHLALALVAGFALAGCSVNPATGKNQLMLVSQDQEIAMGRQADTAVVATIGLYPDAAWQAYIQQLGARLAATTERPDLPWTFRVVDDPAVNAFALPGGFVYVTRGLLTYLTSEAELASVVGHEIGHVAARHTAAEMSKQQIIGLGLALNFAVTPAWLKTGMITDTRGGLTPLTAMGPSQVIDEAALGVAHDQRVAPLQMVLEFTIML